jgi:hypothetical protein
MNLFNAMSGAALVFVSGVGVAAPAFEISGLHIEMPFNDAVAQAEKLGGVCQLSASRRGVSAVYAQCEYPSCDEGAPANACDKQDFESSGRSIAAQPITRVGLEAPTAASPLTRIAIVFEGSSEVIEEHLSREYGPPHLDGSAIVEKSWTHARRLFWKQGNYNMGLLTTVNMIMLTADRANPGSGVP